MRTVFCDYCGIQARFVDSSVIYRGRSYGMSYLCPRCGADLNLGPCGCKREKDPRLAVLEQLLDDKE